MVTPYYLPSAGAGNFGVTNIVSPNALITISNANPPVVTG